MNKHELIDAVAAGTGESKASTGEAIDPVSQNAGERNAVAVEERHDVIVEQVGRRQRCLAFVEFGKRHLLSLEAFELDSGGDDCGGFRFQLLGNRRSDPFELLGDLTHAARRHAHCAADDTADAWLTARRIQPIRRWACA